MDHFEMNDGARDNETRSSRKGKQTWWFRWLRSSSHPKTSQSRDDDEEDIGLLNGGTTIGSSSIKSDQSNSYLSRIFGGRLCPSIIALLFVNILFILVLCVRSLPGSDPLADWGKPGTTSEGLSWYPTDFLRDVIPIPCHSHNDYWRKVPLFSALYNGCISVEADVWYFEGDLFVGHNTASLTANRTFQSLYIKPLVEILSRQNPRTEFYNGTSHGVFDTDSEQSLTLLVDVKTDGAQTWPIVLQQLEPLRQRGWLSYFENGVIQQRPITIVGTGETPFDILTANETYRDAFFDAPLDRISEATANIRQGARDETGGQGNSGTAPTDVYNFLNSFYASTSFNDAIGRVWWGKLSEKQLDLIRNYVAAAHRVGLKARFWEQPAWPVSLRNYLWKVLVEEGVDILNVDDLDAVRNGIW